MQAILRWVGVLLLIVATDFARGQDDVRIPSNVLKSWSHMIGEWNIEGRVGDDPVTGTAKFRWAPGEYCYLGEQVWTIGHDRREVHLMLLRGWDDAKKETVELGFDSLGNNGTAYYEAADDDSDVSKGRFEVTQGSGSHVVGLVERERRGPDEFQLTSTVDGKIVHSLRYVRQKPAGDAAKIGPDDRQ